MRITVFGATGNIGRRVVAEALYRGHEVMGVARHQAGLDKLPEKVDSQIGDANKIDDVIRLSAGQDVVINTMRSSPDDEGEVGKTTRTLLDGLAITGVRLIVSGGAAGLSVPGTQGKKVIDDPCYLPVTSRDVAQASMGQYNICVAEKRVDWTYMSPPASIFPGKRTGSYRLGTDVLLIDAHGDSKISMEDFAMAILDEVERPTRHRARITAAY